MVGLLTMFAPARSTIADRANLLRMMVGIVQGASSTTNTGTLANNAAADAWKNSTLPVTQAFISLISPN
jgi:hypothetical protein